MLSTTLGIKGHHHTSLRSAPAHCYHFPFGTNCSLRRLSSVRHPISQAMTRWEPQSSLSGHVTRLGWTPVCGFAPSYLGGRRVVSVRIAMCTFDSSGVRPHVERIPVGRGRRGLTWLLYWKIRFSIKHAVLSPFRTVYGESGENPPPSGNSPPLHHGLKPFRDFNTRTESPTHFTMPRKMSTDTHFGFVNAYPFLICEECTYFLSLSINWSPWHRPGTSRGGDCAARPRRLKFRPALH